MRRLDGPEQLRRDLDIILDEANGELEIVPVREQHLTCIVAGELGKVWMIGNPPVIRSADWAK